MKRRMTGVLFAGIFLICTVFAGIVGIAQAQSFQSGNNVALPAGREIRQTVFAAGNTIDIGSTVSGDIFCAGQTVTISGTINGDVICAAQTINITGTINGDVRLAGQTITVTGDIERNATVAGQSFTLGNEGSIGGDLSAGASNMTLNGRVNRDAALGSSTTVVAGEVGRNIKAAGDSLTLSSDAKVGGSVEFTSNNDVQRASGATVGGDVTRKDPPQQEAQKPAAAFSVLWIIYFFLAMLLIALALALLFPRLLHSITNRAMPQPWIALLTGFIAHAVAPLLFIIVAATVIGIPLALVAGLAWLLMLVLTGPMVAFYIGRLLFKDKRNVLVMMLVGAAILLVTYLIPILNILIIMPVVWLGTGMMLLEVYRRWPRPSYKPVSAVSE